MRADVSFYLAVDEAVIGAAGAFKGHSAFLFGATAEQL
jgi:hypothetical protein